MENKNKFPLGTNFPGMYHVFASQTRAKINKM